MDPKNKTLIPLIIIFFILGVAVGYVAHKPQTIEKIEYVNRTVEVIVTVTPTPTLTQTPAPTPIPTPTPAVSDFTVREYYDPKIDIPAATVIFDRNYNVIPSITSIRPGQSVVIRITEYTLPFGLTLILNNTYQKDLGASGSVFVTFNKKGTYPFKAVITSSDPTILPKPYADGTIIVY